MYFKWESQQFPSLEEEEMGDFKESQSHSDFFHVSILISHLEILKYLFFENFH